MRDWKVFRPDSGGSGSQSQRVVRKRQSGPVDPSELDEPQFEVELDMNADQLTLMFDDTAKYEQRTRSGIGSAPIDYQEEWRREALRAKADIAETFGPWKDESRLEGMTYFRKATRLG